MKVRAGVLVQAFMAGVWLVLAVILLSRQNLVPGLVALALGLVHVTVAGRRLRPARPER